VKWEIGEISISIKTQDGEKFSKKHQRLALVNHKSKSSNGKKKKE
jgi:hypothetical protein